MIWLLVIIAVAIILIAHYNSLSGFRKYDKNKVLDE